MRRGVANFCLSEGESAIFPLAVGNMRSEEESDHIVVVIVNGFVVSPVKDEELRPGSGRRAGLMNPVIPQLEAQRAVTFSIAARS